jgi:hypothetical protein
LGVARRRRPTCIRATHGRAAIGVSSSVPRDVGLRARERLPPEVGDRQPGHRDRPRPAYGVISRARNDRMFPTFTMVSLATQEQPSWVAPGERVLVGVLIEHDAGGPRQLRLAFAEWQRSQILAVDLQEVERVQHRVRGLVPAVECIEHGETLPQEPVISRGAGRLGRIEPPCFRNKTRPTRLLKQRPVAPGRIW